ncbi:MAG: hypothetical protein DRJ63_09615 [Thermoprotei archaeon]|nr:MAG: hypothetical protein DRJ63_09615 [Thermoprotei archaeon]
MVDFGLLLGESDLTNKNAPIIMRCLPSALMLSHSIRKDKSLLLINPVEKIIVKIEGSRVKRIFTDEASLSGVYRKIRKALRGETRKYVIHPGIKVYKVNIDRFLSKRYHYVLYMSHKGKDLTDLDISVLLRSLFILAFNNDLLVGFLQKISLNSCPVTLHKSMLSTPLDQIIALLNICLDRIEAGFPPY